MSKIKSKSNSSHKLNERQFNAIKLLNAALNFNTLKDKAISAYMYELCINNFGYKEGEDLIFEIDLDGEDMELKVRTVTAEEIAQAKKNLQATE